MLTHDEISNAIFKIVETYPISKVSYFGSYADGTATEDSDLDILVEFTKPRVSLLVISGIKIDLEEILNTSVDVVPMPLSKDSFIEINKTVHVYG